MTRWTFAGVAAFAAAAGSVGAAFGQTSAPPAAAWVTMGNADFYSVSFKALTLLFVLAILIESALAIIFNWRLFMVLFDGRGIKTLVSIAVAALAVWSFDIDIVQTFLAQYGLVPAGPGGWLSHFLTALILAGGSAGVYRILVSLGYRPAPSEPEIRPKPKKDKAWISIKVVRVDAVGPVQVHITEAGPVSDASPTQLAGIVTASGFWTTVRTVFLLDRDRFPAAGGFEVDPTKVYRIEAKGRDAEGAAVDADINGPYRFAPGAIIDFIARI